MRNMTPFQKVGEFHAAFNKPRDLPFSHNTLPEFQHRHVLLAEELMEFADETGTMEEMMEKGYSIPPELKAAYLKEMCDVFYTLYGIADAFGLPIDQAFNRVHASNMSKLDDDGKPVLREDGKVLKGPNYQPPNLGDLVE